MALHLLHQGRKTQGHVSHPQQVHVQNLHKVLFAQPLVGCSWRGDAGNIHQTPESWEERGCEGYTVLGQERGPVLVPSHLPIQGGL